MELLLPTGTAEGVTAAVESGADAVYASFSAALYGCGGPSLTEDEFGRAAEFCRVRGVKLYDLLPAVPFDADFDAAVENARRACRLGADAVVASDAGLIWALRRAVPELPVHAGSAMNIHSLEGVRIAAAMGASRAALSRCLSSGELAAICAHSPIEIEIQVHGPSCAACEGLCGLSAFGGEGSAARGCCSGPCRLEYATGTKETHPLSMKDVCLASHTEELAAMGVAALRVDGIERRPEYVSVTADVYSRAIRSGRAPSADDMELIAAVAPPPGFTDGYFTGRRGAAMFASPAAEDYGESVRVSVRRGYMSREYQRVPVRFGGSFSLAQPSRLTAEDDLGNTAEASGPAPELAFHRELTPTTLQTELFRTGGTPFVCSGSRCDVAKGITLSSADIGVMRDALLAELMEKRKAFSPRPEGKVEPLPEYEAPSSPPALTVSVARLSQLSDRLLELAPPVVYVPLEEIRGGEAVLAPYIKADGVDVCAVLPPVVRDSERTALAEELRAAAQLGVRQVSAGSLGMASTALRLGFVVRGGLGLSVFNSHTMHVLRSLGLRSAVLSPEMSASRVRAVSKAVDAELVVYGRLPLMLTENCIPKACTGICSCQSFTGITGTNGFLLPVTKSFGCRNVVYSPKKLFLAPRSREYMKAGLWGVRLMFTTENAAECAAIAERYLGLGSYEPSEYTFGCF